MLRIGYALMLIAGAWLVGYFGFRMIRLLVTAPHIHPLMKGLILCAGAGIAITLCGLVIEKRREDKHASGDNDED